MAAYGATLEGGVREVVRGGEETHYAVVSLLSLAGYKRPKDTLKQLKEKLEARGGVLAQLEVAGNNIYAVNAVALSNLLAFLSAPAQSAVEALQARLAQSGGAGAEEEEEEADEAEDEEEAEAGTGTSDAEEGDEEDEDEDEEDEDAPRGQGMRRAGDRRKVPPPPALALQTFFNFYLQQLRKARRAAWRNLHRGTPDYKAVHPHWVLASSRAFWLIMGKASPPISFEIVNAKGVVQSVPEDFSFLLQLYRLEHCLMRANQLQKAMRQGRLWLEGIFRAMGRKYGGGPLLLSLAMVQRGARASVLDQLAAASPSSVSRKTAMEEVARMETQQQRELIARLRALKPDEGFAAILDNLFRSSG